VADAVRQAPDKRDVMRVVQSWDSAYKPGQIDGPSVCSAWEETRTGYHLLHVWRGRVEYPTLKAKMAELAAEGKPAAILVEDKASGQSLIQEYRQSPPLPLIPSSPAGAVAGRLRSRTVPVPEGKAR